jgi:hypothetical protein
MYNHNFACSAKASRLLPHKTSLFFEPARVTRLGDFSPLGRFFTLDSFMKNTQLAQICVQLISKVKVMYYYLTKNGLGYILGNLKKKNLSGHPGTGLSSM